MAVMGDQPLFISSASGGRDKAVVDLLNGMFLMAAERNISDIHFDEREADGLIRGRLGNDMIQLTSVSKEVYRDIDLKIRSKSKMELANVRRPLDGRFKLSYEDANVDLDVRVSIVPSINGTAIVCRLLDQRNAARDIESIYMQPATREAIKDVIKEPNGLFLVTGPTGSGKTSTLYSILNELNTSERMILTIEDPVEYRLPGIRQINIEQNTSFPQALKAALRQDPDIILVGEIRDAETAAIAVTAAVTGHLVLSTLHTNDAASTITRLIDLGVDPYTLGSALRGVLAQRLVRRLADDFVMREPTLSEKLWMRAQGIPDQESDVADVAEGLGAAAYSGKVPVMELIVVDKAIRQAMIRNDAKLIGQLARKQDQYLSLSEAGVLVCRQGMTSISEVRSITSNNEMGGAAKRLGELLIEAGELSFFQLEVALEEQKRLRDEGSNKLLGQVLVEMRFCSQEAISDALALQ